MVKQNPSESDVRMRSPTAPPSGALGLDVGEDGRRHYLTTRSFSPVVIV